MKIISLVNQKGGVAKTTTAMALADGFARRGKKVLLVDFDLRGILRRRTGLKMKIPTTPKHCGCSASIRESK